MRGEGQNKAKRDMRNKAKKTYSDFFLFSLVTFLVFSIMEITLRLATCEKQDFFGIGLFIALAMALCFAMIVSLISRVFKGAKGRYIFAIILFVLGIGAYGSQIVYNQIFHTYYTVYSMTHGAQVAQFWRDILIGMGECTFPLAVIIVVSVGASLIVKNMGYSEKSALFGRQKRKEKARHTNIRKKTREEMVLALFVGILAIVLSFGMIFSTKGETNSPYEMFFETNSIDGSVKHLGLIQGMALDTARLVFGFEGKIIVAEEGESETEEQPAITYKANRTVDFAPLIEAETDSTIKSMHEYFDSIMPTIQNEKTGMFAGKNLIMLVGESFSSLAIDPKYTPTLYKLQHEGFYFENFYNPLWGVSTSDGEYVACQGLIPKAGVWSMRESSENYLPYTMGNSFSRIGYRTLAYHNHYAEYYGRTESHPNMGYTYKGLGTGLKVTEMWPESDLQMMELTTSEFLTPDENGEIPPFHVYYMTVSGHLNYNFSGQAMCVKNKAAVASLEMSEPCKAYIACNIELDKAMERLLNDLEAAGQLDDTVIVLSGDHYPYGLKAENISEFLGHEVDPVFELYKSSLIIYNSEMEPETVTKYCSSLDIIPTVANLFGLEYDSRLLMGKDIFSTGSPLVIFKDKSWITAKAAYNAQTKEAVLFDETTSDTYIQNINNAVTNKFNFSRLILEKDYYRHIKDVLYSQPNHELNQEPNQEANPMPPT